MKSSVGLGHPQEKIKSIFPGHSGGLDGYLSLFLWMRPGHVKVHSFRLQLFFPPRIIPTMPSLYPNHCSHQFLVFSTHM